MISPAALELRAPVGSSPKGMLGLLISALPEKWNKIWLASTLLLVLSIMVLTRHVGEERQDYVYASENFSSLYEVLTPLDVQEIGFVGSTKWLIRTSRFATLADKSLVPVDENFQAFEQRLAIEPVQHNYLVFEVFGLKPKSRKYRHMQAVMAKHGGVRVYRWRDRLELWYLQGTLSAK